MYKEIAWENFLKTGNVETYVEYKLMDKCCNDIWINKGEELDETCKGKGDCNTRSYI